jgi:hypothetical protein
MTQSEESPDKPAKAVIQPWARGRVSCTEFMTATGLLTITIECTLWAEGNNYPHPPDVVEIRTVRGDRTISWD